MRIGSTALNIERGLLRIWAVLSVLFILCVALYRYSAIRNEFYGSSYVYGLVVPYNQYGNESLLPVSCDNARGKEDSTLLNGYSRLSIGSPSIPEQSGGKMDLSAGLVPRGSGSSIQAQNGQPGAQQFDLRPDAEPDKDGIVWDTPVGDAASVKVELLRQVANLHVDPSANPGTKTDWCWYRASTFRPLYPEYQNDSDNHLLRVFYRRAGLYGLLTFEQGFHPWAMLFQTVAIAVGIPLGILAVGYACSWAFAGFKSA